LGEFVNWNSEREKYDEIGEARVLAYQERLWAKRAARDAAEPEPVPLADVPKPTSQQQPAVPAARPETGDSPSGVVGEAVRPCRTSPGESAEDQTTLVKPLASSDTLQEKGSMTVLQSLASPSELTSPLVTALARAGAKAGPKTWGSPTRVVSPRRSHYLAMW
jgi:hypothetical protein